MSDVYIVMTVKWYQEASSDGSIIYAYMNVFDDNITYFFKL